MGLLGSGDFWWIFVDRGPLFYNCSKNVLAHRPSGPVPERMLGNITEKSVPDRRSPKSPLI